MYDLEWKRSREHHICSRVQVKVSLKILVSGKIQSVSKIFSGVSEPLSVSFATLEKIRTTSLAEGKAIGAIQAHISNDFRYRCSEPWKGTIRLLKFLLRLLKIQTYRCRQPRIQSKLLK